MYDVLFNIAYHVIPIVNVIICVVLVFSLLNARQDKLDLASRISEAEAYADMYNRMNNELEQRWLELYPDNEFKSNITFIADTE